MSNVSPQHWQEVKVVFEAALEQPAAERFSFIDRACAGNPSLHREVSSLLRSYESAGSFMESPAVAAAAETLLDQHEKLSAGQHLKHYEIVSLIGEGGMGEVYLAKDTVLGRRVALKLLPPYISKDPDRLRRFKQEARTASSLSHPNVCVIHEISESEDGRPFIAMEYIEGVTLRQRIKDTGMKLGDALDIAIQIADALRAAHEAAIVHRDIKPENIMIRHDGYVKVLDFGLAKLTERRSLRDAATMSTLFMNSSPGTIMGTVGYMSPEQARGVSVDERTDIWSLGVVIYEMVSGQAPFAGPTPTDVVVSIVEKEPPPISQYVSETPAELERIVRKALRKDSDERYQIAREMAVDLRSLRKELERNSELDRSVAPSLSSSVGTGVEVARSSTGGDRKVDTNEVDPSRLTIYGQPFAGRTGWIKGLGLAGLAVLVIVGVWFGINRFSKKNEIIAKPRFERINVTKLTTNGNATLAAMSPDGKYVAYVLSERGKQSLWLRQVAVNSTVPLMQPREGQYLGVAFSPDGNFVYFGYEEPDHAHEEEVFRIPVLGTDIAPTKMRPENGPISLSHDRRRLAFVRYDRTAQTDTLIVANADGSNEQAQATRKWPSHFGWGWDTTPAWTPDDKTMVLALMNSVTTADATVNYYITIYEKDLDTQAERIIPLSSQRFDDPGVILLLPDGSGVLVSARAYGSSFLQIWQLNRDRTARPITNDLSDYRQLSLNNEGNAFVTVQTQTLAKLWLLSKGESNSAAAVTSGTSRYFDISWTPDGKILYASDASGNADIYETGADGNSVRQLTADVSRNYGPVASADGRYIVFHSNRSGIFQVWRMDRDGANPKQLTFGNFESNWPSVSPDSKWVLYQHSDDGQLAGVWRVPLDGGTPEKVSHDAAIRPTVSPDGKWFACWHNEAKENSRWDLQVIPLGTEGSARTFEVASSVQVRWDTPLRWSPDSRSVTYVDHRGGIDNIWGQPITGGAPKQLTQFTDSQTFSFDWLNDGRLIASRGVITSDVVLISDMDKTPRTMVSSLR